MLIIEVKKNESIERALRRYKHKVRNTKMLRRLRNKRFFEKPSVTRRKEVLKAAYKSKKEREMEG